MGAAVVGAEVMAERRNICNVLRLLRKQRVFKRCRVGRGAFLFTGRLCTGLRCAGDLAVRHGRGLCHGMRAVA